MNIIFEDTGGALPALSGYNPKLKADLPDGLTVEYYGDDVLYFAWKKKIVAPLADMRRDGIIFRRTADAPEEVWVAISKYIQWMAENVDAGNAFPIEAWAERWL